MGGYRAERIAQLIHREIAVLLQHAKDDRLGLLSITRVEVTKDLRRATVWYLPLGADAVSDDVKDALGQAARQWRGPVGRALGIHHAPELAFSLDKRTVDAVRVASLLDKIGRDLRAKEAPEEGELDDADLEDDDEVELEEDEADEDDPTEESDRDGGAP